MKKTKLFSMLLSLTLWIPFLGYTFDRSLQENMWHTASGKSYTIFETLEWSPAPISMYLVSFQTQVDPQNSKEVAYENYDLLTHFYHFYAPEKIKKKSFEEKTQYLVILRAFQKKPVGEKKEKYLEFTKNFNGVERIAKANKKMDQNRLQGLKLLNAKKFKEALAAFSKIKEKTAQDYVHASNIYLYLGKREFAKTNVLAGLKNFPDHLGLLHNLATITVFEGTYLVEGKYEYDPEVMNEAKKTLQKIIKQKKDDYLAYSNLATVETALQDYKAAEKILNDLISKSAEPSDLYKRVGDLYIFQKNNKKAEELFVQGLKTNPQHFQLLSSLGQLYHKDKKFDKAITYYNQALTSVGRMPAEKKRLKKEVTSVQKNLTRAQEKKPLK
ncbi:MAG: tetratricopeptide repeat protein [Deltaproteobacteria bacterium]|nr:tetratricopeptide repeat protein [Deltaproteobacteria bacterium]